MKLIRVIMIAVLSIVGLSANEDLIVYKVDNTDGKVTTKTIGESLSKSGYSVEKNRDMNGPFKIQFKETTFDIYNLLTAYHKTKAPELVGKYPRAGIFTPFSVAIYKKKGDKFLYVSFLSAKAMSKIVGAGEAEFKALEEENVKAFLAAMPGAQKVDLGYEVVSSDKKLFTEFTFEVEDDEAAEGKEDLEMEFEAGLKPIGFINASFKEFGEDLEKAKNQDFAFYDAYSLCKLKVIYNVAITHPEAGAFAPCTLVMYHKKGEGKTTIVFPNVYNWISTLALKDKKLIGLLEDAQKSVVEMINDIVE